MIMVGAFLWALDGFLTRLESCHGTSSDWVGVCVAGEYIVHHYSLMMMIIVIIQNNNKY